MDSIGVVGGDGTLNEVVQAYVDAEGRPRPGPALALVPAGTGSDFQKTLGIGSRVEDAVERWLGREPRPFDLGILELTAHDGKPIVHAFLNITSFGLGGLTIASSTRAKVDRRQGGFLRGRVACARCLSERAGARPRERRDLRRGSIVNVAIANGRYFGGGMLVAPEADPADGAFDVISMADMNKLATAALTGSIYRGTHVTRPGVTSTRGAVVEAEPLVPNAEVLIDMDGETPGRLPLVARVARGALAIHA